MIRRPALRVESVNVMKPASTATFTVHRFVVARDGAEPHEHLTEADAMRQARRSGGRVYLCVGELATDLWRRPILLAEFASRGERTSRPFRCAA